MTTDRNRQEILDAAIEDYRQRSGSLSHRELAILERDIWHIRLSIVGGTRPNNIRDYFHEMFGDGTGNYESRSIIINAGPLADPVWDAIAVGRISIYTASKLVMRARQLGETQEQRESAVLELLKTAPQKSKYPRTRHQAPEPPTKANKIAPAATKSKPRTKRQEPAAPPPSDRVKQAIAEYTKRVETLTMELLFRLGSTLDAHESADIYQDFIETLKLQLTELQQSIRRGTRRTMASTDRVGRVRFMQACEVLGIMGLWGKPIDLNAAKSRKWERARALHPDHNNSSRQHEAELQAVMDAYDILEQYSQQQHGGQK